MKNIKRLVIITVCAIMLFGVVDFNNPVEAATINKKISNKYPSSTSTIKGALDKYQDEAKYNTKEIKSEDVKILVQEIINSRHDRYQIKNWTTYRNGVIKLNYKIPKDQISKINIATEREANRVISRIIKRNQSDYQKIMAIHDYLVANVKYTENPKASEHRRTAYGALIQKSANCDGFTRAGSLLMEKIGISNYYITGRSSRGTLHAWNLVNLKGNYYHIDLSSDRVIREAYPKSRFPYNYFLMGNAKIKATGMTWNSNDYNLRMGK